MNRGFMPFVRFAKIGCFDRKKATIGKNIEECQQAEQKATPPVLLRKAKIQL